MINELLDKIEFPFVGGDYGSEDFLRGEFEAYFAIAGLFNPRSILEVGVYKGYSACAMMAGSRMLAQYVGIDSEAYLPNSNDMARSYIKEFIGRYYERFPNLKHMEYIVHNFDTVKSDIESLVTLAAKFCWIHIDGGHEKDEALKDITQFWPLVRQGGIMTVHDYEAGHRGVMEAVDEVIGRKILEPDLRCSLLIKSGHNFMLFEKE